MVSIIMIIIYLLISVTFIHLCILPPAFCAIQVYRPSSLCVTFVKIKVTFLARSFSSLSQDICGLGKPSIILQVRMAVSPSRMCTGPFGNNSITGRTTEKKKQLNSIRCRAQYIIFHCSHGTVKKVHVTRILIFSGNFHQKVDSEAFFHTCRIKHSHTQCNWLRI